VDHHPVEPQGGGEGAKERRLPLGTRGAASQGTGLAGAGEVGGDDRTVGPKWSQHVQPERPGGTHGVDEQLGRCLWRSLGSGVGPQEVHVHALHGDDLAADPGPAW
jgi:hypothetical protein